LGHGIETLTYYELQARFDNLTEEEEKYLDENVRHCTSLTTIPDGFFDNIKADSFSEVFSRCESLKKLDIKL